MPKLKTHSGAKKRFKKTGTGKIKRGQTKTRHILSSKSPKVKRKLGKLVLVSDGDYAKVARMIPYATAATTHSISASIQRGVGGTLGGSLGSPPVVGAHHGMMGCAMRRA